MLRALAVVLLAPALVAIEVRAALDVDIIRSIGGLPPHIVGLFEEPLGFQQTPGGPYYVFDRRGHTVYSVDATRTSALKLIEIGQELGRIIQPRGFDAGGMRTGGFTLPSRQTSAELTLESVIINGVASIQYSGANFLISHPESGALITEYSPAGYAIRSIGRLRDTGFEQDRDLHLALNVGLPVVDPTGGFYYVFLGGRPLFRKYNRTGALVFERHIEGIELDAYLASLPTLWATRQTADRELPLVLPAIRAAAVDGRGQLWISLAQPYTYVYDARGDKVRTVQFTAAGTVSPTSLFFTRDGRLLVTPGCYEFRP
jgi:hypothetical protein